MPASAEGLLISALINTSSVGEEISYGISPSDFEGYKNEYTWLASYVETYGCQPSQDIFVHKFGSFPFSAHTDVRSAAEMVHQASNRRRLTKAMTDAVPHMHLGDAQAAYETLLAARPRSAQAQPRNLVTDTSRLNDWHAKPYCIEVPYPSLQRYTGGIRAGNLWYVAARPGQGKSAHLANMAMKAALTGNRVVFYSLEMSEEEVAARFHALVATSMGFGSITLTNLRDHRVELSVYREFIGRLTERLDEAGGHLDVLTPADGPVSPSSVAARATDYHLAVIDYVGLMAADSGGAAVDDWRVMAKISNTLKSVGLTTRTAMLCAAQINRDGETGTGPPKVKNLAQSDALGQDGDVVLTLRAKPHDVATHFSLEKNRHGTSGVHFHTTFGPNAGSFEEISGDHAEDLVLNAEAMADAPTMNQPKPALRVVKNKDEL